MEQVNITDISDSRMPRTVSSPLVNLLLAASILTKLTQAKSYTNQAQSPWLPFRPVFSYYQPQLQQQQPPQFLQQPPQFLQQPSQFLQQQPPSQFLQQQQQPSQFLQQQPSPFLQPQQISIALQPHLQHLPAPSIWYPIDPYNIFPHRHYPSLTTNTPQLQIPPLNQQQIIHIHEPSPPLTAEEADYEEDNSNGGDDNNQNIIGNNYPQEESGHQSSSQIVENVGEGNGGGNGEGNGEEVAENQTILEHMEAAASDSSHAVSESMDRLPMLNVEMAMEWPTDNDTINEIPQPSDPYGKPANQQTITLTTANQSIFTTRPTVAKTTTPTVAATTPTVAATTVATKTPTVAATTVAAAQPTVAATTVAAAKPTVAATTVEAPTPTVAATTVAATTSNQIALDVIETSHTTYLTNPTSLVVDLLTTIPAMIASDVTATGFDQVAAESSLDLAVAAGANVYKRKKKPAITDEYDEYVPNRYQRVTTRVPPLRQQATRINSKRGQYRPLAVTVPTYDDEYDYTTPRMNRRRPTPARRPQSDRRRTTTSAYDNDLDYEETTRRKTNRRRTTTQAAQYDEYYAEDTQYEDIDDYTTIKQREPPIRPRQQTTTTTESSTTEETTTTEGSTTTTESNTSKTDSTPTAGTPTMPTTAVPGYPYPGGNLSFTYGPPSGQHPGYGPSNGNENISITYGPPTGQNHVGPLLDAWYNQYAKTSVIKRIQELLTPNNYYSPQYETDKFSYNDNVF